MSAERRVVVKQCGKLTDHATRCSGPCISGQQRLWVVAFAEIVNALCTAVSRERSRHGSAIPHARPPPACETMSAASNITQRYRSPDDAQVAVQRDQSVCEHKRRCAIFVALDVPKVADMSDGVRGGAVGFAVRVEVRPGRHAPFRQVSRRAVARVRRQTCCAP